MTRPSYEVNLDSLVESEFKRGDVATQARPYCNHPCSGHRTKSVNESAKIVVYLVVYARLWPIVYAFMANHRPVFSDSEDTAVARR